mmetsp:Transcript_81525/g.174706  ORF Transcript_81525/g.174706 Transcript_81525/m.174706 type:complete len:255 (+) Transcript_81525:126-890(+)
MKRISGAALLQRPLLLLAMGCAWLQGSGAAAIATGARAGLRRRLGREDAVQATSSTISREASTTSNTSLPLSALLFGEEQLGLDLSHISQAINATQAELAHLRSSLGASRVKLEALSATVTAVDALARNDTASLGQLKDTTSNVTGEAMLSADRLQAVNSSVAAFGARLGEGPWNLNERISAVNLTLQENITRFRVFRKELFGRLAGLEANLSAGPHKDLTHLAYLRAGNDDLAEQRAGEVEESMALAGIGDWR